MTIDRRRPFKGVVFLCLLAAFLAAGCDLIRERRLLGQWRSESRPEKTLDLFADGTYSLRLSGKGLGFLSDIVGPERGKWHLDGRVLVLIRTGDGGEVTSVRWPINELGRNQIVLAGDRWQRVRDES